MSIINQPNKQSILILTSWFAPGYKAGGLIVNIKNMVNNLARHYTIYILTSNVDFNSSQAYDIATNKWIELKEGYNVKYLSPQEINRKKVYQTIQQLKPDYIYINGMYDFYFNIYPLWLKKTNQINSKIILGSNGMLAPSAIQYKSWKKKPFLFLVKITSFLKDIKLHATSHKEAQDIIQLFGGNISINTIPAFPPQPLFSTSTISKQTGVLDLLFLSRIHPIKNLSFVLNILRECSSEITLNIAGPIEDDTYWETCKQVISTLPNQIKTNYLGEIPHPEVPSLIQKNHLLVLPTKGENYGYIIIEALSQGRPILISNQTPWRNLTQHKAGWDLSLNNPQAFIEAIKKMIAMDQEEYDEWAEGALQYARSQTNIRDLKEKYFLLFSEKVV